MIKIGALISWKGSIGVVVDHDINTDGLCEDWVEIYWAQSNKFTWEEWEANWDLFEVIG